MPSVARTGLIQILLLDALPPTLIVQRVPNRHAEINRMVATGYPVSEIARRLSLDRKTVRHYRDTDLDMLLASARDRRSVPLDRFKPFLQSGFARGNTSGTALFEQLREQGYQGGYSTLTRQLRTVHAGTAPTAPAELPRPRRITGWIMQTRESLSPCDASGLDEVRLACPDIAAACDFARAGVLEGHVNRLRTLKRQMFNRAGSPCSACGSCSPLRSPQEMT